MLNFWDFIQVFIFTTDHHLKQFRNIDLLQSQNADASKRVMF